MSSLDPLPLRCDHCGRPVRGTQHTRTDYRVDYYALHSGRGELCALVGDYGHHDASYIRLLDHYDVISCAQCYRLPGVQAERERRFHPEGGLGEEGGES